MTLSTRHTAVKAWVAMVLAAVFFLEMCAPFGVALAQQAAPAPAGTAAPAGPSAPSGAMPGGTGPSGTPSAAPAPSGPATIPVPAARPTTQPQLTRPQAPPPATEVQPSAGRRCPPSRRISPSPWSRVLPQQSGGCGNSGTICSATPATTFAPVDDVPVGPDYVLGPGDSLTIYVWGLVESVFSETVNRNGEIFVPRAGTLKVWGLTFEKAEQLIRDQLGKVYTGFQISVTLGRLRTIRVFVVGSVARPGSYVLSALSTVTNALFAAGRALEAGDAPADPALARQPGALRDRFLRLPAARGQEGGRPPGVGRYRVRTPDRSGGRPGRSGESAGDLRVEDRDADGRPPRRWRAA